MSWSDERVEILKKLWVDGLSASQIAKQLGSVTRNAVIGKVHRLGLAGRAAPSRPIKRVVRPRPTIVQAAPIPEIVEVETPTIVKESTAIPHQAKIAASDLAARAQNQIRRENGEIIGVLDLMPHMCKWPIGDPTDPDFGFCGSKIHGSWPYCKEHGEIAYQPQLKKGHNHENKVQEERKAV